MLLSFVPLFSPCIVRFAITGHTPCYNKSKLPTHTLCSVWCVYGNVCVTHRHIWISKSVCVCLCQGSAFAFELSPSCVASHGCPILPALLSFSLIICLIDVKAKRDRDEKRGREEEKGMISEEKRISLQLVRLFFSFTKKAAVGDSVPSPMTCWMCVCKWMERGD